MKARATTVLLVALLLVTVNQLRAQKIKVIVDQDARTGHNRHAVHSDFFAVG